MPRLGRSHCCYVLPGGKAYGPLSGAEAERQGEEGKGGMIFFWREERGCVTTQRTFLVPMFSSCFCFTLYDEPARELRYPMIGKG